MNFMAKGWEVSGEYRQVPHLSCIGEFYGEGVGEVLQKSWAFFGDTAQSVLVQLAA